MYFLSFLTNKYLALYTLYLLPEWMNNHTILKVELILLKLLANGTYITYCWYIRTPNLKLDSHTFCRSRHTCTTISKLLLFMDQDRT